MTVSVCMEGDRASSGYGSTGAGHSWAMRQRRRITDTQACHGHTVKGEIEGQGHRREKGIPLSPGRRGEFRIERRPIIKLTKAGGVEFSSGSPYGGGGNAVPRDEERSSSTRQDEDLGVRGIEEMKEGS
jgi:hypothetical protein